MSWIEVLGLGVLGGLMCGGFFYALGTFMDWRENRAYDKAIAEAVEKLPSKGRPLIIPNQRDGADDA